ncbi:MAG: RHS repeat protein [Nitrosomonas sp.]|uniref:RHS repeat-associated core domain-containing protein n=1 Tax=Nitrosomonas sp. TaxID=42353 RepID=UPI0032EF0627
MSLANEIRKFAALRNEYKNNQWLKILFVFLITLTLDFVYPTQASASSLVNDGVVSGEISSKGQRDTYTFSANAGDTIYIRVAYPGSSTPKLVLKVYLYGPDGSSLGSSACGTNDVVGISNRGSKTGTYTAIIRHCSNAPSYQGTGAYTLRFLRLPGSNTNGSLSNGANISGRIDLGDLDTYIFTGQANDTVEFNLKTSNPGFLYPNITIYKSDGKFYTQSWYTRTSASIKLRLAQSDTYTALVVGHNSDAYGDYSFTFNCTNSKGGAGCNNSGSINPQKSPVASCETSIGNPIDFSLGFKYQNETDYASGLLAFKRYYRSDAEWYANSIGTRWRHNYDRTIKVSGNQAHVTSEAGVVHVFESNSSGNWTPIEADRDVTATLLSTTTGYLYTTGEDTREIYDASGKLKRIEVRGGRSLDLLFDSTNRLAQVRDESGRSLSFTYNGSDASILSVTTPDGVFSYSYGSYGNLITVTKPNASTLTYHYENPSYVNALTGITDEKGIRFATYGYDTNGHAISSEHAGGVENYTVTYNPDGSATTTNPLGKQTTYHFETILGVRKVVTVEGHALASCAAANQAYSYDSRGFLTSQTDWLGNLKTYIRNDRGLVSTMTEAAGTRAEKTTHYTYHSIYRLPVNITENGKVTNFNYDAHGRIIEKSITDSNSGQNRTTTYTYHPDVIDANGNTIAGLLASIDGSRTDVSDITSFVYDASLNLRKITNALGHETEIVNYDSSGRPLLITDSNGMSTSMAYDALGRLISSTQNASARTSYAHDELGLLTKITLPNGAFLNYTYDNARRLIGISNSNGKIVYTLDSAGNRISETYKDNADALKYQSNQVFDELSRLKQSIDANNHATQYSYDVNDNITQVTNPNLNSTTFAFDALNRRINSIDPLNSQTVNSINELDQTTGITDPRNNTTHYSYNAFGDLISETSPDRGTTTYTVDAAGNTLSRRDARETVTNYQYDALNRITRISYPSDSSLNTTFAYDKPTGCGKSKGRLCSIKNSDGSVAYRYDHFGRITRSTEKRGTLRFVTLYAYDAAGVLTKITLPSGRIVTYELNADKQVNKITASIGGTPQILASSINYLPFGNIKNITYGNGLSLTNSYNTAYQLTARKVGTLMDESYSYDAAGNITVKGTTHYDYDALDRMLHENSAAGVYEYGYDAISNRLTGNENGINRVYSYPIDSSKLNSIDATAINYDAAGNIVSDGQRNYSIDAAGHVRSVSSAGVITGSYYSYDAKNLRIRKETGSNIVHYVYGLNGLLYGEYDDTGHLIREYVYLNNESLAQVNAGETVTYLHTDHLGTPRIASNSSATKVWEWKSDAFGNGIPTGSTVVNLRFPGQYYDDESGLHYNWNRYYDPKTGRYISSDLIGLAGGLNLYGYVEGNPINAIDPLGLDLVYLNFSEAANSEGHAAFLVGSDSKGWIYYSKDGGIGNDKRIMYDNLNEFYRSYTARKYDRLAYIKTSFSQDLEIMFFANKNYQEDYGFFRNNCGDLVHDSLQYGGIDIPGKSLLGIIPTRPNVQYDGVLTLMKSISIPSAKVLFPNSPIP